MPIDRMAIVGLGALVVASAPAFAQQGSLPREVRALLREICLGPARPRAGGVQTADLNGDGRPDYIIDFGAVDCEGSLGSCGSAGCNIEVLLSTAGGYRNANLQLLGGTPRIVRGSGLPTLRTPGRSGTVNLRWNGRELARTR